ncbi:MFS transporter [Glaciibacter superstes]|uniref:MFS transporter n=1 Tax=Glaciibacter superstes TaxID=501023 RepID=UPI0003B48B6C|nr:MFS transporter [Glaciibacter superstes]
MKIMTPPLMWLLAFAITALCSFYLLLSVVPLYASETGSGAVGAGLVTGAMMLATVVTELFTAQLLVRFGQRKVIAAGILLLSLPALLLTVSSALPVILLVSLLRGAGLAITVVAGTAIAAAIGSRGRQGEVLGIYGVASTAPAIIGLPLGLWVVQHFDFNTTFVISAIVGLVSLVAVPFLHAHPSAPEHGQNPFALLRTRAIVRPTVVFTATTLALGVAVTFLPLATEALLGIAAIALLVQSCATTLARWVTGMLSDRFGSRRFLAPSMLLAAVGIGVLYFNDSPIAVVAGMTLFGIGLGAVQNLSLTLMLENTRESDYDRVSVLWNVAFDSGMGIGSVAFGYLAVVTGYPWAFAALALVMVLTLTPVGARSAR